MTVPGESSELLKEKLQVLQNLFDIYNFWLPFLLLLNFVLGCWPLAVDVILSFICLQVEPLLHCTFYYCDCIGEPE